MKYVIKEINDYDESRQNILCFMAFPSLHYFCGTFMRDSMISAAEVVQNNYYPIKESLINIYDQYFSESNHHSNTRITGNVPIFMVKASDTKPK
ncbi:hypothetical protein YYG_02577 [Plasmodium vinckei petteri]|uniref:Uncharacterized protein n=1 Tax=Plasmodium vinckei petteri TaxID=138298 RepID=W7AKR5_PLAVN|nr:hypothetical protein YYG_02577 [Plasmodium vinckei petteri]